MMMMLRLSTETNLNFPDIWVSATDKLEKNILDKRIWFIASFKQHHVAFLSNKI